MLSNQRICILGSGKWSTAIAKVICTNAARFELFHSDVKMWVYEEMIDGKKLTDIINTTHENVKYLPGKELPENLIAVSDIMEATKRADILVFVVPPQIVSKLCSNLEGLVKPTAVALSLVKGLNVVDDSVDLVSRTIQKELQIKVCAVLMGANLADEIADEKFSETTIGCRDKKIGHLLEKLIQTDYLHVCVVEDVETVEICGSLKDIVAIGAGFVDGLKLGINAKAAIMRIGFIEIIKFVDNFFAGIHLATFYESCGVADLITTCYFDRNRKLAEMHITSGKSIEELEQEMLDGQKLQGPITAAGVDIMIKRRKLEHIFPLFTAINKICTGQLMPEDLIEQLKINPNKRFTIIDLTLMS